VVVRGIRVEACVVAFRDDDGSDERSGGDVLELVLGSSLVFFAHLLVGVADAEHLFLTDFFVLAGD